MLMAIPESKDNDILDAALKCARFGWSVFPCKPDKTPATPHGLKDATTDTARIETWWHKNPSAPLGIACGASGIVVVDYDEHNDPDHLGVQRIADLMGGVTTRMAHTGSGGRHWYFVMPSDTVIRNSAGKIGPGVDVRGDGGYVIAPPSESVKGPYTWENQAKLAPLPEPILEVLKAEPEQPKGNGAVAGNGAVPPSAGDMIPVGKRDATLTSLAGALQRKGTSPLAIVAALLAENQEHCSPPLPETDVRRIAASVGRYPATVPVTEPIPAPSEPSVELLAEDALKVVLTLANGIGGQFNFSNMEKHKRDLYCSLAIDFFGMRGGAKELSINLTSSSARTDLRRELDNDYGKDYGWGLALNTAFSLASRTFVSQDHSTRLPDIPRLAGARDLIRPLMPAEGTTILFGSGASTKSYIANALALASQTGDLFAGQFSVPQANVMYLDFEDSGVNYRRRADRVLAGWGRRTADAPGIHYWHSRGLSLRDQWEAIKRICDLHDIGWIVVDSAAFACGGAPEDAEIAIGLFAAIERIGRPCLMIAHITKTGDEKATQKPFGSAFYDHSARRTWYVAKSQDEDSDEMRVALHCRKVNDGRKPAPIGIQVNFEGDSGPVRFETFSLSNDPELAKHSKLADRIWQALASPMTVKAIGDYLDCDPDVASVTMRRSKNRFIQVGNLPDGEGGRTSKLWARVTKSQEVPF